MNMLCCAPPRAMVALQWDPELARYQLESGAHGLTDNRSFSPVWFISEQFDRALEKPLAFIQRGREVERVAGVAPLIAG